MASCAARWACSMTRREYPVQLWSGADDFNVRLITPVANTGWIKPDGGLWTSSLISDRTSEWTMFCEAESFRLHHTVRYVLVAAADARIFTIDSLDDLLYLYSRFGMGISKMWELGALDFEAMSKHYDILHLTSEGQVRTRFSTPSLYGWDCESSLWLNPVVSVYIGERP